MEICAKDLCCGCGACKDICPVKCIEMREDRMGERRPDVDDQNCITCHLCRSVCPMLNKPARRIPRKCYAAYRKDQGRRLDSASGGIAAALYESFLKQWGSNCFIYGVTFTDQYQAVFVGTNRIEDIDSFKGSKYVQADMQLYQQIAKKLEAEVPVLYVGTPCQVAACLNFLRIKKIETKHFVTVDLLCHGVSPQRYLKEELEYLTRKYHWSEVKRVTFRSNRIYRNFHLAITSIRRKRVVEYNRFADEDPYFLGFLKGITLRESCYQCYLADSTRVSDLTIGDFIGLGRQPSSTAFAGAAHNASMILCNSEKGSRLLQDCEAECYLYERPFAEAVEGGASLRAPFQKHQLRDHFIAMYEPGRFVQTMRQIAEKDLKKGGLKIRLLRPVKMLIAYHGWDLLTSKWREKR